MNILQQHFHFTKNSFIFFNGLKNELFKKNLNNLSKKYEKINNSFKLLERKISSVKEKKENEEENKEKEKGVCMARFPWEAYVSGEGQRLSTFPKRPKVYIEIIRPPSDIEKKDETVDIFLEEAPIGHMENKEEAAVLGYNQLFSNKAGPSNFFLKFIPNKEGIDLKKFMNNQKQQFFKRNDSVFVSPIYLNSSITTHIQKENIPFSGLYFITVLPNTSQAFGKLSLYLQTPGGFWDLSWISTVENIHLNKNIYFIDMLKRIRINWKNQKQRNSNESNNENKKNQEESNPSSSSPKDSQDNSPPNTKKIDSLS
jgi:hypothetical protein